MPQSHEMTYFLATPFAYEAYQYPGGLDSRIRTAFPDIQEYPHPDDGFRAVVVIEGSGRLELRPGDYLVWNRTFGFGFVMPPLAFKQAFTEVTLKTTPVEEVEWQPADGRHIPGFERSTGYISPPDNADTVPSGYISHDDDGVPFIAAEPGSNCPVCQARGEVRDDCRICAGTGAVQL